MGGHTASPPPFLAQVAWVLRDIADKVEAGQKPDQEARLLRSLARELDRRAKQDFPGWEPDN